MGQALTLPELTSKSQSLRKVKKQKEGLGATDILRLEYSSPDLAASPRAQVGTRRGGLQAATMGITL